MIPKTIIHVRTYKGIGDTTRYALDIEHGVSAVTVSVSKDELELLLETLTTLLKQD